MGILQEILKTLSLPEFYFAMFRSATPVLLTTLGAMISSRSGTSNIALEGTMLISAFVGVVVSAFSQSAWIGFLGAVLAGFIVSNILAYFILKLNSNAVISGIALNTFASGGHDYVVDTIVDSDCRCLSVIRVENVIYEVAVDKVTSDQKCQTDEKTNHTNPSLNIHYAYFFFFKQMYYSIFCTIFKGGLHEQHGYLHKRHSFRHERSAAASLSVS